MDALRRRAQSRNPDAGPRSACRDLSLPGVNIILILSMLGMAPAVGRGSVMYIGYSILLTIAAVISGPYWLIRGLREKKYLQNVGHRFGWNLPVSAPLPARPLWLHAVSVGEVLAAKVLFVSLRASQPHLPIIVTTVTATGQALARKEMPGATAILYFPFDWRFCVRRFIARLKPRAVVLMETELWPNFLRECKQLEIPVILANGRVSDKSVRRYRLMRTLTRSMIANVTLLGVQTQEDKRRFLELGAATGQIRVTGNLKFDCSAPDIDPACHLLELIRNLLQAGADTPVIVVGSTMRGEEPLVLDAFARVHAEIPAARMVLAPRHPERFAEVGDLVAKSGLAFRRRSEAQQEAGGEAVVLLLDTIGELRAVYSLASVAVIGGSFLSPFGGHNPLEAAALEKAIVFGPHMSNFEEIARLLVQEQAARQCPAADLAAALLELLRNPRAGKLLGQRAASVMRRNQGATETTVELILSQVGCAL